MLQYASFGVVDGPFGPLMRSRGLDSKKDAMAKARAEALARQASQSKAVVDIALKELREQGVLPDEKPKLGLLGDPVVLILGAVVIATGAYLLLKR